MAFEIMGVPGTIDESKRKRGATRKADGDHAPTHERTVTLLLDVSDDRFRLPLLELFPGCDIMAKSMGNTELFPSAGTMRMQRALPELSVVCADTAGVEVFKVDIARMKNKPELRIGKGGARIEMPVKLSLSVPRAQVGVIDDAVGVDLVFNVRAVQMTIDDHAAAPSTPPEKRARKSKTQVPIVDDDAAPAEADAH